MIPEARWAVEELTRLIDLQGYNVVSVTVEQEADGEPGLANYRPKRAVIDIRISVPLVSGDAETEDDDTNA